MSEHTEQASAPNVAPATADQPQELTEETLESVSGGIIDGVYPRPPFFPGPTFPPPTFPTTPTDPTF